MSTRKRARLMSNLETAKLPEKEPIDFDEFFISFVKWQPEIIDYVISHIGKGCLTIFLDCDALVPFILPYIERQVEIVTHPVKITGPLVWESFGSDNTKIPRLSMGELKQIMDKYKICPKEAVIINPRHIVADSIEMKKYTLTQSSDDSFTDSPDDEREVSHHPCGKQFYRKLHKWCLHYQEILSKIANWNLEEYVMYSDETKFMSKLNCFMNFQSIMYKFPYLNDDDEDEFHHEAQKGIINTIPNSVVSLELFMTHKLQNFNFLKYSSLRKLSCPIASHNQINLIPPCVESLNLFVHSFKVEVTFLDTDKVPQNLKEFVVMAYGFPNIEILIKQMDKLESFKISQYWTSTRIESLCLPDSNITNLVFESCCFDDYSSIRKYKGLKILKIIDSFILPNLLVSKDDFPNLKTFEYRPGNYRNEDPPESNAIDSKVIFPPNLSNLSLEGDITIEDLVLPRNLQMLTLKGTKFPRGIKLRFPDTLFRLKILMTTITSLNGVLFPKNLQVLILTDNRLLKSMTNTNLSRLEHLYIVDFSGTTIANQDMPSETNKYKYNSFTAPIEDRGYGY
ncbi:predicted protein [Candida tropicalis MYA-3404]|uniref:Uncharacterized protein n=1 Tax=Candida tropicalis (strain ATCC MYA-3404 / T1) TaxID=294747 RepID=C5MFA3_CANTT|nr:predicted protein [Candida tropicalis MYA-3404]EER31963.1 predicted protein [Candida tropicalis MYA-3404]KAG4405551.1 hypothetical protein JTP64_005587 [Candida tropicalis]